MDIVAEVQGALSMVGAGPTLVRYPEEQVPLDPQSLLLLHPMDGARQ